MRIKSICIQCLTNGGLLLFFHNNCSRKKARSHVVIHGLRLIVLILHRPHTPISPFLQLIFSLFFYLCNNSTNKISYIFNLSLNGFFITIIRLPYTHYRNHIYMRRRYHPHNIPIRLPCLLTI